MNKRWIHRVLAGLFLAVLFLVLQPARADAAKYVCKIGNKQYKTLQKAVKAVKKGQTIQVTADIQAGGDCIDISNKKSFTIDFANHQYECDGTDDPAFHVAGNLTLKRMNLSVKNTGFRIHKGGKVTIKSGTLTCNEIPIEEGGTLTIKGGTIVDGRSKNANGPMIVNEGICKITGGTFKGILDGPDGLGGWAKSKTTITGGSFDYFCIGNDPGSKLTISGGTFTNKSLGPNVTADGKLTIKGGAFINDEGWAVCIREKASATISDGTFDVISVTGSGAKCSVTGGTVREELFCEGGGRITVSGGTCTGLISAGDGGSVTINNYTVNQGNNPPKRMSEHGGGAMLTASDGGVIHVNGGSFLSPKGYGYAEIGSGKVNFNVENWKKLFKVKKLKFEG